MITASLKTNLILKELGITRFSSRSSANKSIINSIHIYKIDKVSVFLKKDFKEYDIDQKKLILAIMNSTTLTNGESSGQSILFDNKNELDDIIDSSSKLIINFTNNKIKITAKIPIIDSFDIDELVSNPENKKHLWNSIKALLNL
ncbi:MAG: hypothetical protein CMQ89_02460 [Gammaproteobacteria bacterium]|nr:hypothetical protein [Gammaproteobacteria bacterium]